MDSWLQDRLRMSRGFWHSHSLAVAPRGLWSLWRLHWICVCLNMRRGAICRVGLLNQGLCDLFRNWISKSIICCGVFSGHWLLNTNLVKRLSSRIISISCFCFGVGAVFVKVRSWRWLIQDIKRVTCYVVNPVFELWSIVIKIHHKCIIHASSEVFCQLIRRFGIACFPTDLVLPGKEWIKLGVTRTRTFIACTNHFVDCMGIIDLFHWFCRRLLHFLQRFAFWNLQVLDLYLGHICLFELHFRQVNLVDDRFRALNRPCLKLLRQSGLLLLPLLLLLFCIWTFFLKLLAFTEVFRSATKHLALFHDFEAGWCQMLIYFGLLRRTSFSRASPLLMHELGSWHPPVRIDLHLDLILQNTVFEVVHCFWDYFFLFRWLFFSAR